MGPTPDPSTAMATPDPPAYSVVAPAQETDIATAIQTLTNNVFGLKSKWEQAIVALSSLPGADSNILSTPFKVSDFFRHLARNQTRIGRTPPSFPE